MVQEIFLHRPTLLDVVRRNCTLQQSTLLGMTPINPMIRYISLGHVTQGPITQRPTPLGVVCRNCIYWPISARQQPTPLDVTHINRSSFISLSLLQWNSLHWPTPLGVVCRNCIFQQPTPLDVTHINRMLRVIPMRISSHRALVHEIIISCGSLVNHPRRSNNRRNSLMRKFMLLTELWVTILSVPNCPVSFIHIYCHWDGRSFLRFISCERGWWIPARNILPHTFLIKWIFSPDVDFTVIHLPVSNIGAFVLVFVLFIIHSLIIYPWMYSFFNKMFVILNW